MHRSLSDWLATRHVLARRAGHGLPLLAALGHAAPNNLMAERPLSPARFVAPLAPRTPSRRFFLGDLQQVQANYPSSRAPAQSDVDWLAEDESVDALVEPVDMGDDLSRMIQPDEFVEPQSVAERAPELPTTEGQLPSTPQVTPVLPRPELSAASTTPASPPAPVPPSSDVAKASREPARSPSVQPSQPRRRVSRIIEEDARQLFPGEPGAERVMPVSDLSEPPPLPPESPGTPEATEAQATPASQAADATELLSDEAGEQPFDRSPQSWYERLVAQARSEIQAREQSERPVPPTPARRPPQVPAETSQRTPFARPALGLPRVPVSPTQSVRPAAPVSPVIRSRPLPSSRTPAAADAASEKTGDVDGPDVVTGNESDQVEAMGNVSTASTVEPVSITDITSSEQVEMVAEPVVEAEETGGSTASPALPDEPVQWPESSRRFLTPRLGIDPRTVPLHRGAETDRLLTRLDADAATDGQSVLIQSALQPDSPEALGTLAHELTHITRVREPGFVPPMARSAAVPEQRLNAAQVDHGVPEEGIALNVEGEIRAAARRFVAGQTLTLQTQSVDATAPARPRQQRPPTTLAGFERAESPTSPGSPDSVSTIDPAEVPDEWGTLPKPWQPLPSWLAEPAIEEPEYRSQQGNAGSNQTPSTSDLWVAPANGTGNWTTNGLSGSAMARADTGREIAETTAMVQPEPVAQPLEGSERTPEPDLDALARQVYAVLRRRLATERRRSGLPG